MESFCLFQRHWRWRHLHGLDLEERKEGETKLELDRAEIIAYKFSFMKGRFDPLLKHPSLTWMRNSFEHRIWPPTASAALEF